MTVASGDLRWSGPNTTYLCVVVSFAPRHGRVWVVEVNTEAIGEGLVEFATADSVDDAVPELPDTLFAYPLDIKSLRVDQAARLEHLAGRITPALQARLEEHFDTMLYGLQDGLEDE